MMPDLGAYAGPVLMAYAVTLLLLGGLLLRTLQRARKVRTALEKLERRDG